MSIEESNYENGAWKELKVNDLDNLDDFNACISPRGEWYQVEQSEHFLFAYHWIKDNHPELVKRMDEDEDSEDYNYRNAKDMFIEKFEWIFVESGWSDGIEIIGCQHMNVEQFHTLYMVFGEKRLFRGNRIKDYYKQSKYYEGEIK